MNKELLTKLSDEQITTMETTYATNATVVAMIAEIKAEREIAQAKAMEALMAEIRKSEAIEEFHATVAALADELPDPMDLIDSGIYNVCFSINLAMNDAGKPVAAEWVTEVNKVTKIATKSKGSRQLKVYKREGTQLQEIGIFDSGKDACNSLGLAVNGDSALRVLAREGYYTESAKS